MSGWSTSIEMPVTPRSRCAEPASPNFTIMKFALGVVITKFRRSDQEPAPTPVSSLQVGITYADLTRRKSCTTTSVESSCASTTRRDQVVQTYWKTAPTGVERPTVSGLIGRAPSHTTDAVPVAIGNCSIGAI